MEVHRAGGDRDWHPRPGRNVGVLLINGQVGLGHAEPGLQEPLVDGAELADRQAAEVHRAELPVIGDVEQQPAERRSDLIVTQVKGVGGGAGGVLSRVAGEQAPVVGRDAPAPKVSSVDDLPHLREVIPERRGMRVEPLAGILLEVESQRLERIAGVPVAPAVRQEAPVLGICDEQEPEQDNHRLVVRLVQRSLLLPAREAANAHPACDGNRQVAYDILVDAVPEPGRQLRSITGGVTEKLVERAAGCKRARGEEQREVAAFLASQD